MTDIIIIGINEGNLYLFFPPIDSGFFETKIIDHIYYNKSKILIIKILKNFDFAINHKLFLINYLALQKYLFA